jgi:capsular exopolysaccharide synthesis family protein
MALQSGTPTLESIGTATPRRDADGISIGQILSTLWRRRLVFALTAVGIIAVGFVIVKLLTPSFTSTAVIVLSAARDPVVDMEQSYMHTPSNDAVVRSEADALLSRSLVDRVIEREHLMDDPEFNVYAQPFKPNLLTRWGIADHLPGFLSNALASKPLDPGYLTPDQLRYNVATQVLKAYDVSLDAKTYTVKVSFTSIDAEKASRVANAFVQEYMRSQVDEKLDATDSAIGWIKPRLDNLREKAAAADQAVEDFKTANNIVDLPSAQPEGNTIALQGIQNLQLDLTAQEATRTKLEAAEQEVQTLLANPGQALSAPVVAAAPMVENARAQETAAEAHLAELRGTYGEHHPLVIAAESQVKQLSERLNVEVRNALRQLQIEARQAEGSEAQMRTHMQEGTKIRTSETGVMPRLRQLETEAASAHSLYDAFTQGFYRATAADGVPTPKGRIIQAADVVDWPTFPNVPIFMAVIGVAALMIAFAVVYVLEARDKAFHTAREIEEAINLRVLGMTMLIHKPFKRPLQSRLSDSGGSASISRQLVTNPTSAISEMIRLVRTAIGFSRADRTSKVVMVTSAVPGEGKTTFSLMLARLSALSGKRVLVIEAEMRNPTFGVELTKLPAKGLTEYLEGRATLEEIVDVDPESGAHFIAVRERSKFAGELLMSQAMASLLDRARANYDLVVIDTPPVTITADALGLGQLVDTTVLIVRWGMTPAHFVLDAAQKLRAANVHLAGAVISQVDIPRYGAYGDGALPAQYARAYYSMVA